MYEKEKKPNQLEVVNRLIKQELEILEKHVNEYLMLIGKKREIETDLGLNEFKVKLPKIKEHHFKGRTEPQYDIFCNKCGKHAYTTNKKTALKKEWSCKKCRQ